MRGIIWRAAPAKFKTGMCEMKILGSEVLWSVFGTVVQDGLSHMRGVTWRAGPERLKTGICEMKILGSEVLWCVLGHWLPIGNGSGAKHIWIKFKWPIPVYPFTVSNKLCSEKLHTFLWLQPQCR